MGSLLKLDQIGTTAPYITSEVAGWEKMKRGRNLSSSARTLSNATAQGIINIDQKAWLRSVLADGDQSVEEALESLAQGNAQPLRDLVNGGNAALRARLANLSTDSFLRLSRSLSTSETVPNDLDLLTDDLRFSSIGERGQGDGFDLEALLEEVGEMISDTISPSVASTVEPTVCFLVFQN